jgi:hypothetical protein
VFTQTIPALFAGGVCCCVGVADFDVEADFVEPDEDPDDEFVAAGVDAGAGAGAGAAAGVEAGFEAGVAELDAVEEPDAALPAAGCDPSAAAVSDFLVRFFFVVVVLESAVVDDPDAVDGDVGDPVEVPAEAPDAGCEASAVSDFLVFFFFVVVVLESAVVDEPDALEFAEPVAAEDVSPDVSLFFFFFLVVVDESSD